LRFLQSINRRVNKDPLVKLASVYLKMKINNKKVIWTSYNISSENDNFYPFVNFAAVILLKIFKKVKNNYKKIDT